VLVRLAWWILKKRWLEYLDWFLRGFSVAWISARFNVHTDTVEAALRRFVRPGGK
jgi:DNA-binding CsgD family transcriptional regulator